MGRTRPRDLGFTVRASSLLAAGLTAIVSGFIVGSLDLLRVGVLAAALPLAAALVVHRSHVHIDEGREVEPAISAPGERVTVHLTLVNRSRLPLSTAMLSDDLPPETRHQARFVLDGMPGRSTRNLSYELPPLPRGHYTVGPLRMRLTDSFHMVDTARALTSVASFVITPVVDALGGGQPPRSFDIGDNAGSHLVGTHGADDASTREYRTGDDLRKIHWRSTAHRGTVMVRQEERPWQGQTTLLLDTRSVAHEEATIAAADPRQSSSFEWAVSAVASIGTTLMSAGREVGLIDEHVRAQRRHVRDPGLLAQRLGPVRLAPATDLGRQAGLLRAAGRDSALVAVLGRLDATSLQVLTAAHPRGSTAPAYAILLDVESFAGHAAHPAAGRSAIATSDAARVLRSAGWRVIEAARGDRTADVWQQLLRSSTVAGVAEPVPLRDSGEPRRGDAAATARSAGAVGGVGAGAAEQVLGTVHGPGYGPVHGPVPGAIPGPPPARTDTDANHGGAR